MKDIKNKMNNWAMKNFLNISIFNLVMISLYLLRSAGYFDPYFLISVNFIVIIGLILSIFLFGANSRAIFIISLLFWLFAGFLLILNLDTWAERTAVYCVESLVIGVVLLFFEDIRK